MAYANKKIEIPEAILSNTKFIEFKSKFINKNPGIKIQCGNNYIMLKGGKKHIIQFTNYIDTFYEDTSIYNIKLKNKKRFKPLNDEQTELIDLISNNDITFVSGSAGTGKTMVTVILAAYMLKKKKIEKLIITRPAVEAGGEKIGHLPGDVKDKMLPYLMPIYDYLEMMFSKEEITTMEGDGRIEIIPLAFMRGRSLTNSMIIVDEAQNTTFEQIKMISTRIGFNSKIVFCGDVSQNDMKYNQDSGLEISTKLFSHINGIGILKFSNENIVRHPIIKEIIKACEDMENEKRRSNKVLITEKKEKKLVNSEIGVVLV